MIAVLRKLLTFIKKDYRLLSNYERSHPHFFWYLGLDALISLVIAFAGFHFIVSKASATQALTRAGVVAMSSDELIIHVKNVKIDAYWLGAVPSSEYTINDEVPGIADVFYLPLTADKSDSNSFLYEVKTYKSREVWDAHGHTLLATANTTTIAINKDLSIKINRASMRGEIATFHSKSEIVAMAYPSPQSLQTMIKNAKELKPIQ
jgi:hypothetical protein